jgi:uncharacterized membrane protein HdeD (DUF308 family)
MTAQNPEIGGPLGQLLRREAARWWWAPLVAGIIWLLIGWAVLRADVTSLATVGVLVGIVFLVAAVSESGLAGLALGGWKVVHIVLAVVFLLGALWSFIRPINTFFALASVLGLLLLIQGLFSIARAAAARDVSPYWWVGMVCGVLILLLGLWVSVSDRVWDLAARAAFLLVFVGFYAIFRGINDLVLAFELRRVGRDPRDGARDVVDEAPRASAAHRRTPDAETRPDTPSATASGA